MKIGGARGGKKKKKKEKRKITLAKSQENFKLVEKKSSSWILASLKLPRNK
jgi:hypothetical protein